MIGMPQLWYPGVNLDHEFAQDILFCTPLWGGGDSAEIPNTSNLVGDLISQRYGRFNHNAGTVTGGPFWTAGGWGRAAFIQGGTDCNIDMGAAWPQVWSDTRQYSFFVAARSINPDQAVEHMIGLGNFGDDGQSFAMITSDGGFSPWAIGLGGQTGLHVGDGELFAPSDIYGHDRTFCAVRTGQGAGTALLASDWRGFTDGVEQSLTVTAGNFPSRTDAFNFIGEGAAGSLNWNGPVYIAMGWERAIGSQMVSELHADPFLLIRPRRRAVSMHLPAVPVGFRKREILGGGVS